MFLEHFGLVEQPFGVTPDPRFLHLGRGHREALASLIYGTESNRGFLALVGSPGVGKTSLLFQYLEIIRNRARTAFLFQSAGDGEALMRYLLYDLGQDPAGMDLPAMHRALNNVLEEEMRSGRQVVLVLDEAQNLSEAALEFVRLLSNFETPWAKLLQIVLAGQPQLTERLARPRMEQIRQRISCFIRLDPFTPEEASAYIDHRLWAAGYSGTELFTPGARIAIAELGSGVPRNINNLCFHAMSLACAAGRRQVDAKMVRDAASDSAAGSSVEHFRLARDAAAPVRSTRSAEPKDMPVLTVPLWKRNAGSWLPVASMLFVVIVLGALWKAGEFVHPLGVTPSVQASVLPEVLSQSESPRVPTTSGTMPIREETGAAHAGPGNFAEGAAGEEAGPQGGASETAAGRSSDVITVIVGKGTTMRHLSLLFLERYDLPTMARLCAFNGIADPNQIEIGQTIRIPLSLRRPANLGPGITDATSHLSKVSETARVPEVSEVEERQEVPQLPRQVPHQVQSAAATPAKETER